MERNNYPKLLSKRPPPSSQSAALFWNSDNSGFNAQPVAKKASFNDSFDELDSLPPRVLRDTDEVIKGLKFNRHKLPGTETDGASIPCKENTRRVDKKSVSDSNISGGKSAVASTSKPLRDKAPNRDQSPVRSAERQKRLDQLNQHRGVVNDKPAPQRRPQPRPQFKPPAIKPLSPVRVTPPSTPIVKAPRKPAPFPDISPVRGGDEEEDTKGKGKGKAKDKDKERKTKRSVSPLESSTVRSAGKSSDNFLPSPLASPMREATSSKLAEFPAPSPLKEEPSKRLKFGSEDKEQVARPFPIASQFFDGIGDSPRSSTPSKRRSIGSESEDERDRKRYKKPVILTESYLEEDSELLFMAPNTDPSTLCPYCDSPLPSTPTPLLTRLLEQTFRKSYRDARPTNPLGRKAPMGVFVAVCQRHRFESQTLPEAEARGWPKSIDWGGLKGRVLGMRRDLASILADRGDALVYNTGADAGAGEREDTAQEKRRKGPRMRCTFWKELLKEVKSKGTKGVKGMQGQFANFEKTQPGYYGELGSVIIHQTLYDMFPLANIDPDLVNPLTPNEFIQRILVPEVGMRLVIQDMFLDVEDSSNRRHAVAVLRESASYGVAMFPEDGGEWAAASGNKKGAELTEQDMGVAELMVMERARKRRKELEVEEREEEEMWNAQQEKEEAEKKRQKSGIGKEKGRAKKKGKETDTESSVAEQAPTTPARPRPRPVLKSKAKTTAETASSGMDTDVSSDSRWTKNPSDIDMTTAPATVRKKTKAAPKTRPAQLESDEDEVEVCEFSPVKPKKSKPSRRAKTPCSDSDPWPDCDEGIPDSFGRPRSPSVTVSEYEAGSRRSTRGNSVVDICSSSEDGSVAKSAPKRRTAESKKLSVAPTTPLPSKRRRTPLEISSTSEGDNDNEETPRRPLDAGSTRATSSAFFPLQAARNRTAAPRRERPAKSTEWTHTMAMDISDDEDSDDADERERRKHAWLLSDSSQSQSH